MRFPYSSLLNLSIWVYISSVLAFEEEYLAQMSETYASRGITGSGLWVYISSVLAFEEEYFAPMSETYASRGITGSGHPCRPLSPKDLEKEWYKGYKRDDSVRAVRGGEIECNEDGFVVTTFRRYPCQNVGLASFVPLNELFTTMANDVWGWISPTTGVEYALVGLKDGTGFVNLKDPENPVILGKLPSRFFMLSNWRDIKVYKDHMFVVAEALRHGMQIFDLTRLDSQTQGFTFFTQDAHFTLTRFGLLGHAHNLFINEDSGFAYIVGSNLCLGGPLIVDISNPTCPKFEACIRRKLYTHDIQCINYENGPDPDYEGHEICFAYNTAAVDIFDVTDKQNIKLISVFRYPFAGYTHQGWVTPDLKTMLVNDELDEVALLTIRTRTIIADITDLDNPVMIDAYRGKTKSIDHNLYIKDQYVFEANYRSGLRILDASQAQDGTLKERGFFDVVPIIDDSQFGGAWSSYIWFESIVVVSVIEQGLFILRPDYSSFSTTAPTPSSENNLLTAAATVEECSSTNVTSGELYAFNLQVKNGFNRNISWSLQDSSGQSILNFSTSTSNENNDKNDSDPEEMKYYSSCLTEGCYVFVMNDYDTAGSSSSSSSTVVEGVAFYRAFVDSNVIFRGNSLTCSEQESFCISSNGEAKSNVTSIPGSKLTQLIREKFF